MSSMTSTTDVDSTEAVSGGSPAPSPTQTHQMPTHTDDSSFSLEDYKRNARAERLDAVTPLVRAVAGAFNWTSVVLKTPQHTLQMPRGELQELMRAQRDRFIRLNRLSGADCAVLVTLFASLEAYYLSKRPYCACQYCPDCLEDATEWAELWAEA